MRARPWVLSAAFRAAAHGRRVSRDVGGTRRGHDLRLRLAICPSGTVEGFVFGWSMIALALDIDPGIRWEEHLDARDAVDAPVEIATTLLPRFEMTVERMRVNETREHSDVYVGEEPYVWMIPVLMRESPIAFDYRLLPTREHRFQRAYAGQVVDINAVSRWGTEPGQAQHLFVVVVGWEADFTSERNRRYALVDALASIETELERWISGVRPLSELADRIGSMLRWQLPHYYRNPEAQPGHRRSDDDFVGAEVIHFAADDEPADPERSFVVRLRRSPKPRPRFTDLTLDLRISFKDRPA